MRIHHRTKISFEHDTEKQAIQRLNMFLEDISVSRDFVLSDQFREEVFISPGAFCKLVNAQGLPENTHLCKGRGSSVGNLGGIPARSPVFSHPHYRDLEGLAEMQIEYRIIGD